MLPEGHPSLHECFLAVLQHSPKQANNFQPCAMIIDCKLQAEENGSLGRWGGLRGNGDVGTRSPGSY